MSLMSQVPSGFNARRMAPITSAGRVMSCTQIEGDQEVVGRLLRQLLASRHEHLQVVRGSARQPSPGSGRWRARSGRSHETPNSETPRPWRQWPARHRSRHPRQPPRARAFPPTPSSAGRISGTSACRTQGPSMRSVRCAAFGPNSSYERPIPVAERIHQLCPRYPAAWHR